MRLITEAFGLLFGLLVAVWVVSIYSAPIDKKAVAICRPVHYAVNGVGYAVIAANGNSRTDGAEPGWQDKVRLMCLKAADRGVEAAGK